MLMAGHPLLFKQSVLYFLCGLFHWFVAWKKEICELPKNNTNKWRSMNQMYCVIVALCYIEGPN